MRTALHVQQATYIEALHARESSTIRIDGAVVGENVDELEVVTTTTLKIVGIVSRSDLHGTRTCVQMQITPNTLTRRVGGRREEKQGRKYT
jgi:hypothetical protein